MKQVQKKMLISTLLVTAVVGFECRAQISPSGTYMFAQKDSCELFMDVYEPAEGSSTEIDGIKKPSIIFMFGGGFKSGSRDDKDYRPWFKALSDDGFRVFSIDYRLGLKNVTKVGIANAVAIHEAIEMAVEDLFSATAFIIENAASFGVDPTSIVISGSSAGAISSLQAEWECANGAKSTEVLPEGFQYAGVMSFSGAVFSKNGKVRYKRAPAPTLLLHGTSDKIVNYHQIAFFKMHFSGSHILAKEFSRKGYNYNIYRFEDNGHEIASAKSMMASLGEQMSFIRNNVMQHKNRVIDAVISDSAVPVSATAKDKPSSIYSED